MTTDRPRRRRPAQAARRLVGGASLAAALDAVAAGVDHVTVPTPGTTTHAGTQVGHVTHSTTRAS